MSDLAPLLAAVGHLTDRLAHLADLDRHAARLRHALTAVSPGRAFVAEGSGGDAVLERWIQDHLTLEANLATTTASREQAYEAAREAYRAAVATAQMVLRAPATLRIVTVGGLATQWMRAEDAARRQLWWALMAVAEAAQETRDGLTPLLQTLPAEAVRRLPMETAGLTEAALTLSAAPRREMALAASLASVDFTSARTTGHAVVPPDVSPRRSGPATR